MRSSAISYKAVEILQVERSPHVIERKPAALVCLFIPQPNTDILRSVVDLWHLWNLSIFLLRTILIDTDGVDP